MGHGTLATVLGLTHELASGRLGLPVRRLVADVMLTKDTLQSKAIYVGRGSFHHRLTTTKWKSPWTPGHNSNCETGDWLRKTIRI